MISDSKIRKLERKSRLNPKDIIIQSSLVDLYIANGDYPNALKVLKKIIELNKDNILAWMNMGKIYQHARYNLLAINCFLEVLRIDKNNSIASYLIGVSFDNIGISDEAIIYYSQAISLNHNIKDYYTSLLFALHRNSGQGFINFQKLAKIYNNTFLSQYPKCDQSQFKDRMYPNKKIINLGFLSCDLYKHPVMTNFLEVLKKLSSKQEFNLFFYYTGNRHDQVTEVVKLCSSAFHDVYKKPIDEINRRILEDKIDILFDISGYENKEYFGVLKSKPAPVQVTHIGYWGTLGLDEVDFIIADNSVVRTGEEQYFSEKVYKMSKCYASGQISGLVDSITIPPCIKNGYITFGSMNKFHKINHEVLEVWAKLLTKLPDAKLLFGIIAEANENFLFERFEKLGIDRSRIIIKKNAPRENFLTYYNEIDIALNPFPFSGGTTTLESISMGVPIINLDGNTWAGRLGTTIISAIGHEEFNCKNTEEYIDRAISFANNIEQLKSYRKNLKKDIEKSCLNVEDYTDDFTKAIFDMWSISCEMYHSI